MIGLFVNVPFWSALDLTLNQQAHLEPDHDGAQSALALSSVSVVSVISAIIFCSDSTFATLSIPNG